MKIALVGYGKMGREIEQIAISRGHEIILKVNASNSLTLTSEELRKADVAIEFSTPSSVLSNINKCFENNIPIVVGTTGWNDKAEDIKKVCTEKKQAIFYASNFSIGVNIFFKVNEYLAKIMNQYPEYNVTMNEIHHVHKKDSPSGTALTLAWQIIKNVDRKTKWVEKEVANPEELEIISRREGEVPGTHVVKYHSEVDSIEISHIANNRQGFALGAVMAAEFLKGKKGVYGMDDLLKE
jgi:4-hydroxy-tetrahydrodipicolinate reductase